MTNLAPLLQQIIRPLAQRLIDIARNSHDIAILIDGQPGRDLGTAAQGRLHNEHGLGNSGNDPVANREKKWTGNHIQRKFADDAAVIDDLPDQAAVARRESDAAARQH